MYQFLRTALTKCHKVGDLNNGNLFSHTSECLKFKNKGLVDLISSAVSSLGLQMTTCSLCPHMFIPQSVPCVSPNLFFL